MMTEQEIMKEIAKLTKELEDTKRQHKKALAQGDPDEVADDLENDCTRIEDEIDSLEYDLSSVRGE